MKVRAQGMDSYEARVANTHLPEDELERQSDLKCDGHVVVTNAYIDFGSITERYRPYMQMSGEVRGVKLSDKDLELAFPQNERYPKFNCRYNFTNDELSELAAKGIYEENFQIPDIFIGNKFELPMTCSICSVKNADAPIIFARIENAYAMETSSAESGYDLVQYFEKVKPMAKETVVEHAPVSLEEAKDVIEFEEDIKARQAAEEAAKLAEEQKAAEEEAQKPLSEEDKRFYESLDAVEAETDKKIAESQSYTVEPDVQTETEDVHTQNDEPNASVNVNPDISDEPSAFGRLVAQQMYKDMGAPNKTEADENDKDDDGYLDFDDNDGFDDDDEEDFERISPESEAKSVESKQEDTSDDAENAEDAEDIEEAETDKATVSDKEQSAAQRKRNAKLVARGDAMEAQARERRQSRRDTLSFGNDIDLDSENDSDDFDY